MTVVCVRNPARLEETRAQLVRFLKSQKPDHFVARHEMREAGTALLGLHSAPPGAVNGASAYVGWLRNQDWSAPVGSFAMIEAGKTIKLRADAVASRTLFFAHDAETFVASTSQRAIPYFLGGYQPNPQAHAWMLSSGSLGPGHAWDRRARLLGPYGQAWFHPGSWRLEVREPEIGIEPQPGGFDHHASRVLEAVDDACAGWFDGWAICLSGGRDSRNLLQRIAERSRVSAVTWGDPAALNVKDTDACIASILAKRYGVPHTYYSTALPDRVERVFQRYLLAGDGRVDHLGGYTDGFELWRAIGASGVLGVIRGENLFGCHGVTDAEEAGPAVGMHQWRDLPLPSLESLGIPHLQTTLPPDLLCKPEESGQDYYHRLMHAFRQPTVLAALTDLKAAYTEIANPFLSAPVVAVARTLPSAFRDHKVLFNRLADPSVPFARDISEKPLDDTLRSETVMTLLLDTLHSQRTRENYSDAFVRFLSHWLTRPPAAPKKSAGLRRVVGRMIPADFKRRLVSRNFRAISAQKLALRVYLTEAMHWQMTAAGNRQLPAQTGRGQRSAAA